VAEAAHYLRFLARSTGKVRFGIGAAREDVNVSITSGTRIEIKGVAHITWIPRLTHIEAYRQKALLTIREKLLKKITDTKNWHIKSFQLSPDFDAAQLPFATTGQNIVAVLLPGFKGILSHFTQPGKNFANELSDRLKVIACLEKPNQIHSEQPDIKKYAAITDLVKKNLQPEKNDAWICFAAATEDIKTALETIEERCHLAFEGVPRETRKALADGTTLFERVLPGADRMYPDTDSAPIPIENDFIENLRSQLPLELPQRLEQLKKWQVPEDCWTYLLRNNLMPLAEQIIRDYDVQPLFVCTLIAQDIKGMMRLRKKTFSFQTLPDIFAFLKENKIRWELIKDMIPIIIDHPKIDCQSVLILLAWKKEKPLELFNAVPYFTQSILKDCRLDCNEHAIRWIMGKLRPRALGNVDMKEVYDAIEKQITREK
jgi:glutamyl-tRNA(Gln) amidotransferase subunit E